MHICFGLTFYQKKNWFSRILSQDDLHLLALPEPPTVICKNDNRSSLSSGSVIASDPKASVATENSFNKSQNPYQQEQSSTIFENIQTQEENTSPDEKSCMNNLKNIIHKLESVILFVITYVLNVFFVFVNIVFVFMFNWL